MLLEILQNKIQIVDTVQNWQEAIKVAAFPLLKDNCIEMRYIDAMIEMTEKYTAYIVLNEGFAMPHASSEFGVKRMSASLTIFKNPINFMGKFVGVVLCIAPIDKTSHMRLLQDVAVTFSDPQNIIKLVRANNVSEIESILKKLSESEVIFE